MNKLLLVIALLILLGCASQTEFEEVKMIHKIEYPFFPGWVYELPAGDYVIGMARKSFDEDEMKDAAKQMAAVMKSRNEASYSIEKFASTTTEDLLRDGKAEFYLNVSASPETTRRIYESLQVVDEEFFFDYYLALFSIQNDNVAEKYKKRFVTNFPDWYERNKIVVENVHIVSYASGSSSHLINAWESAAENARLEIAKYLEKDVQTALISIDEEMEKSLALETTKKLIEMKIRRCFISSELHDNLRSYKVFMEMVIKK
jgi:hypothetical protein